VGTISGVTGVRACLPVVELVGSLELDENNADSGKFPAAQNRGERNDRGRPQSRRLLFVMDTSVAASIPGYVLGDGCNGVANRTKHVYKKGTTSEQRRSTIAC
jgi:hypothetical protein